MLSLILPTYNEAENIPVVIAKAREVLGHTPHEIIVVDDNSPDETWRVAQELADGIPELHVIRRLGRRGLSSAVVEGFLAAKGDVLMVMDADGQHDVHLLPQLEAAVRAGAQLAIGSRYAEGGSVGDWDERRFALSRLATKLAVRLCKVSVADPMSGFFAVDRRTFEHVLPRLNPTGFKILLDVLVHVPRTTVVKELPLQFGARMHGESKLSRRVQIEFLEYLYDVVCGRFVPLTFVKYCIVGGLGVIVHVAAYLLIATLVRGDALSLFGFSTALIGAIETAIIFNFWLNNRWTFVQSRLRGMKLITGFGKYNVACLFGALANYAVSSFLFTLGWAELFSVIIGAFTGVFWNYTMSRLFAWKA